MCFFDQVKPPAQKTISWRAGQNNFFLRITHPGANFRRRLGREAEAREIFFKKRCPLFSNFFVIYILGGPRGYPGADFSRPGGGDDDFMTFKRLVSIDKGSRILYGYPKEHPLFLGLATETAFCKMRA